MPSRWEGQSNALLEAMACGRAVLASEIPVFREVAGPDAVFAGVDDPAAWAGAISRLAGMGPAALADIGVAMRARVTERYDAATNVAALIDVYRDVVRA
jgi:glycosyltransferase involved in cell wall biosynthesis